MQLTPTNFQQYQQTFLRAVEKTLEQQQSQSKEKAQTNKPTNEMVADKAMSFFNKGLAEVMAYNRMAMDELSQTLKAFPDSIGVTPEPGTAWEPTPQQVFAEQQGLSSPMQLYQRDLYTQRQDVEQTQEVER